MPRHRARDCDKGMLSLQIVTERLLTGARDTGSQPVRIENGGWIDDMHRGAVGNHGPPPSHARQCQTAKTLVDRDLKDRRRRVDRAVNRPHALAVPAAADTIGAFAAIPCRGIGCLVEPPCDQLGTAERNR
jgi:hypothetical protein